jgi:hypothetical protein
MLRVVSLTCLAALAASCGKPVDVKTALQVIDVRTGYFDAGVKDGKNRLVPDLVFRIKNVSGEKLTSPSINVIFKKLNGDVIWDEVYFQHVDFKDNNETGPITARASTGYTGDPPQSRADMLRNSYFEDLYAQVFVKQSSSQWVELHRVTLERKLLTE